MMDKDNLNKLFEIQQGLSKETREKALKLQVKSPFLYHQTDEERTLYIEPAVKEGLEKEIERFDKGITLKLDKSVEFNPFEEDSTIIELVKEIAAMEYLGTLTTSEKLYNRFLKFTREELNEFNFMVVNTHKRKEEGVIECLFICSNWAMDMINIKSVSDEDLCHINAKFFRTEDLMHFLTIH